MFSTKLNLLNLFLLLIPSFYTTISFRLISTHHTALAASMCSIQKQYTNNITHQHCHHWPKPLLLQQPWSPSYLDNIVSSSNWLNTQAVLLLAQSTKLPYLFIDDAWVTGFLVNLFITSNNSNWNHKCGVFKLLPFVVQKHRIIDQIDDVFRHERPI